LNVPRHPHLDVWIDRAKNPKEGCAMAPKRMMLRSLASGGALVLMAACGTATAGVPGSANEEAEAPEGGTEEDPLGGTYQPDCRTNGSEMLPC
jgi:hypothetical protein